MLDIVQVAIIFFNNAYTIFFRAISNEIIFISELEMKIISFC